MVCLVVAGDLRHLIGFVLLSLATSWEVLVNENIFDVMEFIEKYARVEGGWWWWGKPHQLELDFIDDETNFQDQEPTNYCLMNVTRDLQDAISDRFHGVRPWFSSCWS